MSAPTQCVILCGGLGTRLGALTADTPKPLLPVGGRPFLATLVDEAARFGFEKITLLASYKAEAVEAFARTVARPGLTIEVVREDTPRGTAGALRQAIHALDERFLLLNGDSWFDCNWLDLVPAMGGPRVAAMALRHVDDIARYGAVTLAGDVVSGFAEKGGRGAGLINAGVYLLRRSLVETMPQTGSLEADVLPAVAARGQVGGVTGEGFFIDIGVPEDFERAQRDVPARLIKPAAFLDRDGTINVDQGYTSKPEQLAFIPGAVEAIRSFNRSGRYVFVITNQGGVAHGFHTEADIHVFHAAMQAALRAEGAHVDDWRYCPYHPEGKVAAYTRAHNWRKPAPGMILDLMQHWPVAAAESFVIGDSAGDVEAGRAAGLAAFRFEGGDLAAFSRAQGVS